MSKADRSQPTASRDRQGRTEQRLHEMLQESQRRQAEISALLKASKAVLQYREFPEAARSIFDICKELLGATSGYVALLDEAGMENEVLFLDAGGMPCTVDPSLPMPIRGLRERAYRTGTAVYENDFFRSAWAELLPAGHAKLENVLFAPLSIEGRAVGLLGIANKPGGFCDRDARMAEAFGELAAIALQNSRTLEALENSEERFRSVTQSASDAIVTADTSGNIVYWNEAAQRMFGYTTEEILGKPLARIMPTRLQTAHQDGIRRLVATGESRILGRAVEVTGVRCDGSEFPIELSLATWKNKEGAFFTGHPARRHRAQAGGGGDRPVGPLPRRKPQPRPAHRPRRHAPLLQSVRRMPVARLAMPRGDDDPPPLARVGSGGVAHRPYASRRDRVRRPDILADGDAGAQRRLRQRLRGRPHRANDRTRRCNSPIGSWRSPIGTWR